MRRSLGNEGMGWAAWIAIVVVVLCVLGAVGLAIYGGTVEAPQRHYEQVVPNDRFPS